MFGGAAISDEACSDGIDRGHWALVSAEPGVQGAEPAEHCIHIGNALERHYQRYLTTIESKITINGQTVARESDRTRESDSSSLTVLESSGNSWTTDDLVHAVMTEIKDNFTDPGYCSPLMYNNIDNIQH